MGAYLESGMKVPLKGASGLAAVITNQYQVFFFTGNPSTQNDAGPASHVELSFVLQNGTCSKQLWVPANACGHICGCPPVPAAIASRRVAAAAGVRAAAVATAAAHPTHEKLAGVAVVVVKTDMAGSPNWP